MPVGVALLLEYLGVVLVVGWLWLRHGQRPRRLTVAGGLAALAGLALVLNPSTRIDPIGVVWALLAAVGLALYYLLSAAGREPVPPLVLAWAAMWVGAAGLGALGLAGAVPMRATTGGIPLLGHRVSWVVPVLGLSLLPSAIGYIAGIGAARRLGARLASFIGMAEVLFAILFAWLVLHQLPAGAQFLGGAFILGGVTLVRLGELRPPPAPPRSPAEALRPAQVPAARP
jgi:drug/metabolite transporter (DMT)-like permease